MYCTNVLAVLVKRSVLDVAVFLDLSLNLFQYQRRRLAFVAHSFSLRIASFLNSFTRD